MSPEALLERLIWSGLGGFVAIWVAIGIGHIKGVHPTIKTWACRLVVLKMVVGLFWGMTFQFQASTGEAHLPGLLTKYLLLCWATGAIVVMTNFCRSILAVRKIYSMTHQHEGWARLMFHQQIEIREAPGIGEPCVCGILRPCLILPTGWQYKQGVLVHEWAHIHHSDLRWNALSWLTYALFWFVPGQARLNAEMNLWQEVRADLVARERLGVSASSQAETLLRAIEKARPTVPLILGQAGHAASVARRLEALYCRRYNFSACVLMGAFILAVVIPIRPVPDSLSSSTDIEVSAQEFSIASISR